MPSRTRAQPWRAWRRHSPPARWYGLPSWTRCWAIWVALEQDDGQRLGGKSAEAARFILRAVSGELDNA